MVHADQIKASGMGLNEDIFSQICDLLKQVKCIKTLRKIVNVTSDHINTQTYPQSVTPSDEQLDSLFKYIPTVVSPERVYRTRSAALTDNVDNELVVQLREELDSMDLYNQNSNKVRTQWLVDSDVTHTHTDLRNSQDMNNFPAIVRLRDRLNQLPECKGKLSGCIVNCYSVGSARLRPHSDNEPYINQESSICTFSLGDTREFGIFTNSHKNPQLLKTYSLESDSVFIMQPGSQAVTKHRVLPSRKGSSPNGVRYSI